MTTISASVVADSISPAGIQLTTLKLRYPKWIHGEFLTHRVFSRNASSSRAIPVTRLIEDVERDPAVPLFWGANQKGMQAGAEHSVSVALPGQPDCFLADYTREEAWLCARDSAVTTARAFASAGYHKQLVNRLLEPFCHIEVLVTGTEWDNFFSLRRHPDAEPHMQLFAERMWEAMQDSSPILTASGEWHLPFTSVEEIEHWKEGLAISLQLTPLLTAVRVSVARCARVSYLNHDGTTPDIAADLALYSRLVGTQPLHASPAEHQATPDEWIKPVTFSLPAQWANPSLHGNFRGWVQYRKTLEGALK